jgi:hypothetical protein
MRIVEKDTISAPSKQCESGRLSRIQGLLGEGRAVTGGELSMQGAHAREVTQQTGWEARVIHWL